MALYALVVSLFVGPDVDTLGADDWREREAAQTRLRAWGWLARPTLKRVELSSENPEIRTRSRELVKSGDEWIRRVRLAAVLSSDVWPDEGFWTEKNRWDVFFYMRERGVNQKWESWAVNAPWRIRPDLDRFTVLGDRPCPSVHERCNQAVSTIRIRLGVYPVAPAPREVKPFDPVP